MTAKVPKRTVLESPGEMLSSKSGIGEIPGMICPGAKFLSM